MSKYIIHNLTDQSDTMIFAKVSQVIAMGRISDNNKSYCAIAAFTDDVRIYSKRNKSSDTFIITKNGCRGEPA